MNQQVEFYRVLKGPFGTIKDDNKGLFFIPFLFRIKGPPLKVLCSPLNENNDWEHISVSLPNRCPTWEEMSFIKQLFWGEDKTVVQFHPPQKEYINNHKYCLHMWYRPSKEFELPPSILVGIK